MRLPNLSQLQARFAACLGASIVLLAIYYVLSSPRFAYAAELDIHQELIRVAEDHNWGSIEASEKAQIFLGREDIESDDQQVTLDTEIEGQSWVRPQEQVAEEQDEEQEQEQYTLLRRATPTATASALPGSNTAINLNIQPGQTQNWTVANITSWNRKSPLPAGLPSPFGSANTSSLFVRANGTTQVFISINTCLQPQWNGTIPQTGSPPQLSMIVTAPTFTQSVTLDEGFASVTFNAASSIDITVEAPSLNQDFTGGWNYELAASVDNYYHNVGLNPDPPLYWVDSDTTAALLVTANLTYEDPSSLVYQQWMNSSNPFIVYVQNAEYDNVMAGVRNSFCGLQNAPIEFTANPQDPQGITSRVKMGMIDRSTQPQQQFYVENLNGSATYEAILAMQGNSSARGAGVVGGGGWVSQARYLSTKSDGNCALLYNLSFCSEVAYAVPSNPNTVPSFQQLQALYDGYASSLYQNFTYSLQLIPCNTTSSAQYSLARNCSDCAAAYKQWLCAVTIPRCDDFTSDNEWLHIRNVGQVFYQNDTMLPNSVLQQPFNPMPGAPGNSPAQQQTLISTFATNQSRNPALIDDRIMPGPYKELLPCEDLCYSLVQSCPAALGFSCPYPGKGLSAGYNPRDPTAPGNLSCSFLGAAYNLSAGSMVGVLPWMLLLPCITGMLLVWTSA
ncbi:hypothetical protein MBLNU457_3741t3 [Dothideomycetes sp. NU457]